MAVSFEYVTKNINGRNVVRREFTGSQICKQCLIEKDANDYEQNKSIARICKQCKASRQPKKYDRAKAQFVWIVDGLIQLMEGCAICNEKCIHCLCFHHKDPTIKEGLISKLMNGKDMNALIKEIQKCIIVCYNCHMKIHRKVISCEYIDTITMDKIKKIVPSNLLINI